jgi:apolipoprotein N-acyltransferase
MAVPTNDWKQVKDHHFENALFRAVENRYAVVRGASNGISAVVTARGEVLARMDHFREGPGVIVCDLPLYPGGSFYSRAGEWVVLASMVFLVLTACLLRVRGRKEKSGTAPSPPPEAGV